LEWKSGFEMPLHLKIENESSLPDGGPIEITVTAKRGIDIGRDQYLDWVLPDATRFISGKHCEIRYRDGAYLLIDVSTNGTFVNGGEFRLDGPHALKSGDRIDIGHYIISVVVEPEESEAAPYAVPQGRVAMNQVWDAPEVAPPVDPRLLKEPNVKRGLGTPDVLDWIADIPAPLRAPPPPPLPQAAPFPPPLPSAFDPPRPPAPPAAAPPPLPAAAPAPPPPPMPAAASVPAGAIRWDLTQHPFEPAAPESAAPIPAPISAPTPAPIPAPVQLQPAPPPLPPTPARSGDTAEAHPMTVAPAPEPPPPKLPPAASLPTTERRAMGTASEAEFISRFAKGLGLPPEAIAARSAGDLAEEIGVLLRITADNLKQLQAARAQSKGAMRSSNATMVQALDNNPLKFAPTTEDALRILFGPRTTSYLDARRTLESSFIDIKKHQALVFSAMQTALRQLIEDLDPERIEAAIPPANGVAALLKSRPGELWNHYQITWKAKAGRSEHKMLDVFMRLFAEAYDEASG
jgi:type VI secretion system protein ImpI